MKRNHLTRLLQFAVAGAIFSAASVSAQDAAMQAKIDAKKTEIAAWGKDPGLAAAVKAFNAAKPDFAQGITQADWDGLSIVDAKVRSFQNTDAAKFLKSKKADWVAEAFVSCADGTKAGFLQKTSGFSHKGKPKHDDPMAGKVWQGKMERDDSTGMEQVQVGVPVLDGTTPVGSLVVGIRADKL